ncbi:MAG: hypothetical protein HQ559_01580, partial [Lentisphaerae bacterium]|nr:hypothetical protein [Lentisphaerota bacterium]
MPLDHVWPAGLLAAQYLHRETNLPVVVTGESIWEMSAELNRMHNEMNRLFGDSFLRLGGGGSLGNTIAPRLDLSEEGDDYVVRMELPGADKASI